MAGQTREDEMYGTWLIVMIGLIVAATPIAVDSYTPAFPTIAQSMGVEPGRIALTLSAFFLGLACGGIAWGPLSDRFGRRPILMAGLGIYLLAAVGGALATDATVLLVARAVQGLASAAMPAAGLAMTRDAWAGDRAARAISLVMLVIAGGPLVAPLLGGQLLTLFGWRSIFWFMAGFAALALVLVRWWLPETNPPARRSGVRIGTAFRAYGHVLSNPRSWLYLLCGGMAYGALFAYVTGVPFVYIDLFGVDPRYFGFLIAVNVVGSMTGNWLNARLVTDLGASRMLGIGIAISLAGLGALLVCTLAATGGLVAIVVTLFIGIAPVPMISANSVAGLMNLFPRNAGACSALYSAGQFGFGALSGTAVSALYAGTPVAMAGVMFGCGVIVLLAYLGLQQNGRRTAAGA